MADRRLVLFGNGGGKLKIDLTGDNSMTFVGDVYHKRINVKALWGLIDKNLRENPEGRGLPAPKVVIIDSIGDFHA